MAQIVLQHPWALLLLPLGWLLLVLFAWPRRFKPFGAFLLRLLIVVLVVLALAQPILTAPESAPVAPVQPRVVLVDQSASLGAVGQQALRSEAARLAQGDALARVLLFGDRPVLVADPLAAGQPGDSSLFDAEASNLAGALAAAGELLRVSEPPGRVVLLSDGLPTEGGALDVAARLARQGFPVDVLLPDDATLQSWHDAQNEVRVADVSVPPVLRQGETFDLGVLLHTERSISATLRLSQDGVMIAEDVVALTQGLNRLGPTLTAAESGLLTFQATVAAAAGDDRQLQNNSLSAFTQVFPPPTVLVVSAERVAASRMTLLLREAGIEAETMPPERLPARPSELEPYAGLVLLNVPAQAFELEQMIAIQEFVRSQGRGLVVAGGRSSFGLGRYDGTPLADLLPVSLEPPPREERPPVALLLIIDHSGSMVEQRVDLPTRLTMAKEAAIRATDILGPEDLIGILMFDNRYEWVVPFQQVSDGAELLTVQQRIARIPPGGGTRILQALEVGIPELIAQDTANSRHIVLLTDGKSFDGDQSIVDYNAIVDEALAANITLSTIAIGTGADEELLSYLAERGLGRYHFAETPEELPALTISESDILRSDALQEGDFGAAIYAPHPIIRGLFASLADDGSGQPPNLSAYLAMTPKAQAEVALQVGPGDPLLSVWGYGLGRVAAWSSDTGSEWARDWRDWPEASRFWGQVVGYTLPAPDLSPALQLDTGLTAGNTLTLAADSLSSTGQPVERADTQAALATPGGQVENFALRQIAPGLYERTLRLPAAGAYGLTVEQARRGEEEDQTATTGVVLPYPAEYALPAPEAGESLLAQIADLTGGNTFQLGGAPAGGVAAADAPEPAQPTELWPWLLQLALILWPLEIAARRWGRLRIQ